eukprot:scaffold19097_cov95-Isochrysis_galbana.AAC.3
MRTRTAPSHRKYRGGWPGRPTAPAARRPARGRWRAASGRAGEAQSPAAHPWDGEARRRRCRREARPTGAAGSGGGVFRAHPPRRRPPARHRPWRPARPYRRGGRPDPRYRRGARARAQGGAGGAALPQCRPLGCKRPTRPAHPATHPGTHPGTGPGTHPGMGGACPGRGSTATALPAAAFTSASAAAPPLQPSPLRYLCREEVWRPRVIRHEVHAHPQRERVAGPSGLAGSGLHHPDLAVHASAVAAPVGVVRVVGVTKQQRAAPPRAAPPVARPQANRRRPTPGGGADPGGCPGLAGAAEAHLHPPQCAHVPQGHALCCAENHRPVFLLAGFFLLGQLFFWGEARPRAAGQSAARLAAPSLPPDHPALLPQRRQLHWRTGRADAVLPQWEHKHLGAATAAGRSCRHVGESVASWGKAREACASTDSQPRASRQQRRRRRRRWRH